MKWIIDNLAKEAKNRKRMLGTTAPTNWEQKEWDDREKKSIKELFHAVRILKQNL